jgi:F-type H+-transporting ATPase subunit a
MVMAPISLLADVTEHILPHFFGREEGSPPPAWGFSNHILMMLVAAALALLVFTYVGAQARRTLVPRGLHNFFESILSFLRTELIRPALRDNADRFTPFIWTVFFFILFCNLLGLIPVNEVVNFVRSLGKTREQVAHMPTAHIWGTATANFSVTGGMAILAFCAIHVSGIIQQIRIKMNPSLDPHHQSDEHLQRADHAHGDPLTHPTHEALAAHRGQPLPVACVTGAAAYVWNFAPHPQMGWKPIEVAMYLMLLLLELIGALVKPFSLCIRLFANMVAGHLVLAALVSMIPFATAAYYVWGSVGIVVIAGCTALSLLELFVAFLQAYIFTFLTTLFIASAVAPEH